MMSGAFAFPPCPIRRALAFVMKRSMKRNFTYSDSLLSAMDSGKALHVAAAHPAHLGVMLNAGEGGNGDGKSGSGSGSGDNGGDAGKGNDNKNDGKSNTAGKGDDKLSYDELELQYLRTQKALRKANREAEQRRLELEEAKAGKKSEKKSDEGNGDEETEKLKKQLSEANEKSRKRIIKAAVMLEASKLGFHDPNDAFALADLSDIEFDEEKDDVSGVEDALRELAKRKPHLIKTAESSNGQPSPKKPDTNAGAKGKGKDGELAIDEEAIRRKYSIR